MVEFKIKEIFGAAIRIEESGKRFYRKMAEKVEDDDKRELFNYLAEEEIKHKKIFEELISKVKQPKPLENYPREYFTYLKSYADKNIFNLDEIDEEIEDISDMKEAIDFAIGRELDSILYYQELKTVVPKDHHKFLNEIIKEERWHFTRLTELRKSIF